MNITPSTIYWLCRLDGIRTLLSFIAVVALLTAVVVTIAGACIRDCYSRNSEEWNTGARLHKKVLPFALMLSFLLALMETFMPSTRELAAIIVIPKIVNNEKVQDVGNRIYDLAVEWMDELSPKKNGRKEKCEQESL